MRFTILVAAALLSGCFGYDEPALTLEIASVENRSTDSGTLQVFLGGNDSIDQFGLRHTVSANSTSSLGVNGVPCERRGVTLHWFTDEAEHDLHLDRQACRDLAGRFDLRLIVSENGTLSLIEPNSV